MSDKLLPLASMQRVLKNAGAIRVSDKAMLALKLAVEDASEVVALKAIKFASHAGRRTVKAEDIILAFK